MEEQSENCFSSHVYAVEYYSAVERDDHQPLKDMVKSHIHIDQWKNPVWRESTQYDPIYDILGKAKLNRW